jgi:hypothetical protein
MRRYSKYRLHVLKQHAYGVILIFTTILRMQRYKNIGKKPEGINVHIINALTMYNTRKSHVTCKLLIESLIFPKIVVHFSQV